MHTLNLKSQHTLVVERSILCRSDIVALYFISSGSGFRIGGETHARVGGHCRNGKFLRGAEPVQNVLMNVHKILSRFRVATDIYENPK